MTVVGAPDPRAAEPVAGAVVTRSTPPAALSRSIEGLRGDSLTALALAIGAGILIGFAVASLIATRVKRLASSAERMAQGRFDEPLPVGGRDEIGDLARALDSMREALRESFNMLATERDRLSAILDGLTEAVIVVGADDEVRFSNPSAAPLISDGKPLPPLRPTLKRAAERGSAQNAWLRVEDRVYAVQARRVPAERTVLLVARDRTEELRRELAEREFVSNAAHELRNPLAGISGAIEVLRAGAKDDDEARDHFLGRLADDAERMTRLTQSLLDPGAGRGRRLERDRGRRRQPRRRRGGRRRRSSRGGRALGRDRARAGRRRGPDPAAAGADRPAHERLQEHARAGRRYASRPPQQGERGDDRGRGHGNGNPR